MSDSVRPRGQQPAKLLHPQDSPGKNTGMGCHRLLQALVKDLCLVSTVEVNIDLEKLSLGSWCKGHGKGPKPQKSPKTPEETAVPQKERPYLLLTTESDLFPAGVTEAALGDHLIQLLP